MRLFICRDTNDLIFSDLIEFEPEFEACIHQTDVHEYYMDDNELEYGLFDEVDYEDWDIYKRWCEQHDYKPHNFDTLRLYFENINNYGCEIENDGIVHKTIYAILDDIKYEVVFKNVDSETIKNALKLKLNKKDFVDYLRKRNVEVKLFYGK